MAKWMSGWLQGVYGYVANGQPASKLTRKTVLAPSSSTSSAGALHRKTAQKRHTKPATLKVKHRRAKAKTLPSNRNRTKGGGEPASDAESDAEISSQKITAAEKAAVNAEVLLEPVERLDRADPQLADWTDAEIVLFNNLQDRGLEPILPDSFKLDFATLPQETFTSDDAATLINSRKGHDLHAIRALQSLFRVGSRIRPLLLQRRHAPAVLLRAINAYVKWAMDDANLSKRDLLPVLVVKANRPNEKHHGVIKRTRKKLHSLAARHRERYEAALAASDAKCKTKTTPQGSLNISGPGMTATAPSIPDAIVPPVLFGIILVKGVMTFCSLDASLEDAKLQTIAIFDWAQSGQDVWNALAIAILVTMVRDYLEGLGAEMRLSDDEDDPDA